MEPSKLAVATACFLAVLDPAQAVAEAPRGSAHQVGATASASSGASDWFSNYSIRLGFEAAGPLLFRDTPDRRVEETTVLQFGPRLAFLFGHEINDIHRAGLGVSYLSVAKSDSRRMTFIPIYLMYEIGHPLVLQATAGANLTSGTDGFASNYGGVHTGLALRYSFQAADKWSPVTVSPGIAAQANLAGDMQYSSVFLGAQLEIMYDTNNQR